MAGAGVSGYFVEIGGSSPQYRFASAELGPLTAAVSASGNLNAVITVQVGSQVSGQIKELLVDFNSVVKKGQVIARIDPDIFEAKVIQARADLDSAKATVLNQQAQIERSRADADNARAAHAEARAQTAKAQIAVVDTKRDLDRKTELFARQLIAKSDLDSSQAASDSAGAQLDSARAHEQALASAIQSAIAQLRVAEAMLESARAQVEQKDAALKQAQVDLDHTTISAPVDGVVVSRQVDVGQTVAASLQAPVLFTIAQDLTKMQVETSVDEADIGRVKLNDQATFTVDAFPNETFVGRVTQIRKAAQVVQNVVTYTVVVAVDNPSGRLLPGMTANVKLVVAEKSSVLKLPNAALRFRPAGGDAVVPSGPPGGATASGQPSLEQTRDWLVPGLKLSADQQKKLEPVLPDRRKPVMAPQSPRLAGPHPPPRAQKLRDAARVRIREILTPEPQTRYDELSGVSRDDRRGGGARRAWLLGPDGKPAPVPLTLGLSAGTFTEILRGDLKEGQEVIVGLAGGAVRGAPQPQSGPRLRL